MSTARSLPLIRDTERILKQLLPLACMKDVMHISTRWQMGSFFTITKLKQMHGKRTSQKEITFHSGKTHEHTIISLLKWMLEDSLKKSTQKLLQKDSPMIPSN